MAKSIPHKKYQRPEQTPRKLGRNPEAVQAEIKRRSPLNDSQRPSSKGRKK